MEKYKKNCDTKSFEKKLFPEQDFTEYNYAIQYEKKAILSFQNEFRLQSIDDYFTSIQLLSNSILLKKFSYRAKESVCSYYELYLKDVISETDFEIIEKIREKRNEIHYDGYRASINTEEEILKYVNFSKNIIKKLKNVYEGKKWLQIFYH